jgi:DNA-binding response OmpR family regulator
LLQGSLGKERAAEMSDWLLVVDDDDGIREAYARHFVCANFEVRCAANLAKAVDLLASTRFDAVIVDASLTPEGSGGLAIAAYVQHLRRTSLTCPAPVLILTAYGCPWRARVAAQVGVDVFLHKPVSLVWLEHEISALIGARRWVGAPTGGGQPPAGLLQHGLRLLAEGLTR